MALRTVRKLKGALALSLVLCVCFALFPRDVAKAYPEYPLPYKIHVSRTRQIVTVTDTATGEVVRQMICSTGAASSPTVTGQFRLPKPRSDERKNWYAFSSVCYAHYATRITGRYLFHSILYKSAATSSLDRTSWNMIGNRASHGCIRMTPLDAQWIAYNCAEGTIVRINDSLPPGEIKSSSRIKRTLPSPRSDGTLPGWEATLKPTPKPDDSSRPTLDVGIEGSLTKGMQSSLRSLGYFSGSVNGKFGEDTKAALQAFQAAYLKAHLGTKEEANADGLGTQIWQDRVKAEKTNTALAGTLRTLKLNTSGTSVKALRERLQALGYTSAAPSNNYDAHTRDMIKLFQRRNGLSITGTAKTDVQNLLMSKDQTPLSTAFVNLEKGLTLRKSASSKGSAVVRLKFNAEVKPIKDYGDWTYVLAGKKFGFVQTTYLRKP